MAFGMKKMVGFISQPKEQQRKEATQMGFLWPQN